MADISFDTLCRSEFYNNVSAKQKVQDNNIDQLKLKVNDKYEKDEKIPTKLESSSDEDVINKANLDKKLTKTEAQISYIEKKL